MKFSRSSVFAVWLWPKWTWAFAALLALGAYPLSEAPLKRMQQELHQRVLRSTPAPCCGFTVYDAADITGYRIYRPAHYLFDHTPLQKPLIAWGELWGVDIDLIIESGIRTRTLGFWSPQPGVLIN